MPHKEDSEDLAKYFADLVDRVTPFFRENIRDRINLEDTSTTPWRNPGVVCSEVST